MSGTQGRDDDEASLPRADDSAAHLADRPLAFYNTLLTGHFVLESARGITVSESSSRASLYVMTLSSALVAFSFLASTPFALGFLAVIIPVVIILGVFTYERLVQTSLEDVAALASIQRIRRYYGSLLPGAEQYFPVPRARAPNELLEIGQRNRPLPLTDVPPVAGEDEGSAEHAPVLVLIRYTVPVERRPEFESRMRLVGRPRRRTGARDWRLYNDREHPSIVIEAFSVGTWSEHLSQHDERMTEYDRQLLDSARALADGEPVVEHLLGAESAPR